MTTPLLEMRNISIHFGGIKAVDDVSIDLMPGEVVLQRGMRKEQRGSKAQPGGSSARSGG